MGRPDIMSLILQSIISYGSLQETLKAACMARLLGCDVSSCAASYGIIQVQFCTTW